MPQIAAGISGFLGGLTAVELALVKIGGSLLLSAASRALMPKSETGIQGRNISVRQPVAPGQIVYGRQRKGGTMVFLHEAPDPFDPNNESLHIVIVLAAHRVKSIGAVWFDGEQATDAAGTPIGRYVNKLEVEKRLGDVNQTAFSRLMTYLPAYWTQFHRLRGLAAVYLRLPFDPDVYPNGVPNITVDIEGKDDIQDPRTGIGGYTANAALCLADYMAHPRFGLGAAIEAENGIDTARLIASANICDEVVATVGGLTERRYTCNGVITLDQTPKTVIEAMLTPMAGTCGWQGGKWHLFAGGYEPPVLTFTDDDVAGEGWQMQTRVSMAENFNAVRGQFVSPENDWQPDDFPAYESAAYLTEDNGEKRWSDITLPFTISSATAQRLAKIHLERQRRQFTLSMTGKLSTWRATVGDTVLITRSRWGFSAKPFEVRGVTLGVQGDGGNQYLAPEFLLRETSPLVYDWTASEEKIYAAAPRTTLPSAFDVAPPGGLSVTESLYQTTDGAGVKAKAVISWSASTSRVVAQYQVEARLPPAAWQVLGRTDQTMFEYLDIQPGQWEFQVKAVSQAGVSSPYSPVLPQEIYGLGSPPAGMGVVTLQGAGGTAILKWSPHPDLDVTIGGRIVIRHSASASPDWTNSVSMDVVAGAQAIAVVPLKPGTYLIRAEDASGVPGPVSSVPAAGAQAIAFGAVATLTEDTTFTGVKSGTVASAGTLTLDASAQIDSWASVDAVADIDAEGGILPTGSYTFAAGMDLGSVKNVRLRSEIELSIADLTTTIDERPGDIDSWTSFDGADGAEVDVVVEVRTTPDNPSGSPVWSGWSRVDNAEVSTRGIQARAILTTADPNFAPVISKLRLKAEEAL